MGITKSVQIVGKGDHKTEAFFHHIGMPLIVEAKKYFVRYTKVMKDTTSFEHFDVLDLRVGKIVNVEDVNTKKPTYRITVDFGSEVGTKVSCGAYRNYSKEELIGKQVIAVVNFGVKQMGPEKSEVLILGVPNEQGETIYLMPQIEVPLGVHVF